MAVELHRLLELWHQRPGHKPDPRLDKGQTQPAPGAGDAGAHLGQQAHRGVGPVDDLLAGPQQAGIDTGIAYEV